MAREPRRALRSWLLVAILLLSAALLILTVIARVAGDAEQPGLGRFLAEIGSSGGSILTIGLVGAILIGVAAYIRSA